MIKYTIEMQQIIWQIIQSFKLCMNFHIIQTIENLNFAQQKGLEFVIK